jgi:uncharacterized delta-60 repeat protein
VVVPEYQEGQYNSTYSTAIVRYNKDGSLDSTFNGNGKVTSSLDVRSIAIQSDGKIVAAGRKNTYFAVARYNTDGSLDKTFSDNGIQTTDLGSENDNYANSDFANSVIIQKDGKIVGVGQASSDEHSEIALARYNPDGSLDNTFSDDGKQTTEISGYLNRVTSVALQSNGKIAVAGGATYDDYRSALYVALYNSDGSLYRVFSGFNSTDGMNRSRANSIAIQPDDKILIAGQYKGKSVLARLKKDGTLDSTFSNLGKQTVEEYIISDIAIFNNKFYAVGSNADNMGVIARYLLDDESQNKPPTVSLTTPTDNSTNLAPADIWISAAASDTDGSIRKVQFYNGTTLLHTEYIAPYNFIWRDVPAGNYTLTAKATDNLGLVTTSAAVHISIVSNKAPTVRIIKPHNNQSFAAPAYIRLKANAKDPGGRITRVEFYNGSTLLSTEYRRPYKYVWKKVPAGTYTITAKAYNDKGLSATSKPVTIKVKNASIVSRPSSANDKTGLNNSLSLKVGPVPARSTLQIYTKGLQLNKQSTISVISFSGVVMKTIQSNASDKVVLSGCIIFG